MGQSNRGSGLFRIGLLASASASALLAVTPALAQPANQPPAPPIDQNAPPATTTPPSTVPPTTVGTEGDTSVTRNPNEIVVTGTRIRSPEFTSPDPVSRIDPATAQREGKLSVAETLQSSPIAAGSTQITSAISSNFVTNGGPGAQTIDLRGLGANRTLVLLNGRRAGPAGTRGGVSSFDLNVLPQSIVKQVDILKTGASSIYGSDAIAGVVNLITKTDFNGLQVDGFINVPFDPGGEQADLSVLWGKTFGDRGHIMLAADYFHQRELARGDRSYLACPNANVFTDESHDTRADLVDPRTGKFKCEDLRWGHIWTYDRERQRGQGPGNLFNTNGVYTGPVNLIQYQYPGENLGLPPIGGQCGVKSCFSNPPGWFPTGYDMASLAVQNAYHPFVEEQTIIPKTTRITLYGDASYKFSDAVEVYGEFLANRRKTYQNGWRQFWTFGGTEDFYGTYWAQGWEGKNLLSPTGITNHFDSSQKVDYWRGVGGVRGDFGGFLKGWSYDAYVQYSHNKGTYGQEQFLQDIYDVSYFQTQSCVGTTLRLSGKQCINLPWVDPYFMRGEFTPEQADFMFDWDFGHTKYTQLNGEASVTGNLFDLPAGPVGVALGVTVRQDKINDTPGDITMVVNPDFDPNIPLTDDQCQERTHPCNQIVSNAWGVSSGGITAGKSVTSELFGEIQVPLLRDRPFFKDLSFSGAARLTNVKSTRADGVSDKDTGNWTYKLGGNWAVNDWLRFRGTYGTSFRAPALFEQFKADETGFVSARTIDPCVNWAANEAAGVISHTVAANCNSQGIPVDYGGGTITATTISRGGIGVLDPETSTAKTASIILTPRFAALPHTRLSVAVDYYDIIVKGEVSQLGASTIVFNCYESTNFPNDPLCALFTRGLGDIDPFAITSVTDPYINIAKQQNRGIDVTALVQQGLGRWGSLNLLANMTWTLRHRFSLFAGEEGSLLGIIDDNSGRTGTRRFVGQFNATWKAPENFTLFYGVEVYSGASNAKAFGEAHADDNGVPQQCVDSINAANGLPLRGHYCVDVSVPATFYHAASITKEFPRQKLEITAGIRNIFDTRPPTVSTIGGTGIPGLLGPVVATSQYDFVGRRFFLNISKKF